ncbi:MAG TPA: hypothetical protein VK191_17075 [Symbiobacteriaceae bacterium]|nr:hypothetical protein [Symbiobacteriaceae bacterium]
MDRRDAALNGLSKLFSDCWFDAVGLRYPEAAEPVEVVVGFVRPQDAGRAPRGEVWAGGLRWQVHQVLLAETKPLPVVPTEIIYDPTGRLTELVQG